MERCIGWLCGGAVLLLLTVQQPGLARAGHKAGRYHWRKAIAKARAGTHSKHKALPGKPGKESSQSSGSQNTLGRRSLQAEVHDEFRRTNLERRRLELKAAEDPASVPSAHLREVREKSKTLQSKLGIPDAATGEPQHLQALLEIHVGVRDQHLRRLLHQGGFLKSAIKPLEFAQKSIESLARKIGIEVPVNVTLLRRLEKIYEGGIRVYSSRGDRTSLDRASQARTRLAAIRKQLEGRGQGVAERAGVHRGIDFETKIADWRTFNRLATRAGDFEDQRRRTPYLKIAMKTKKGRGLRLYFIDTKKYDNHDPFLRAAGLQPKGFVSHDQIRYLNADLYFSEKHDFLGIRVLSGRLATTPDRQVEQLREIVSEVKKRLTLEGNPQVGLAIPRNNVAPGAIKLLQRSMAAEKDGKQPAIPVRFVDEL